MKLKQAKEYFDLGVIHGLRAYQEPMGNGWLLVVDVRSSGGVSGEVIETALGVPRVFASLDTLYGQIRNICGEAKEINFVTRS